MSFLSQPLETIFIQPKRMIGTIAVQVVTNEVTTDTLTITKQPVQQGAPITDHSYMEPATFSHTIYFAAPGFTGGTSLNEIYTQLQSLQSSRIPFTLVTPKRIYTNMLMGNLTNTTDKLTENCLAIHANYQQVILVPVSTTTAIPRSHQKNAGSTGATQNAGNKSILFKGAQLLGLIPGGG
jgi:hypothetical protein